jgi:hypothetical protein
MIEKHKLIRTPEIIKAQIRMMNAMGWNFIVQHGTYTTKIHTPNGITTYSTINFANRVFVASNMVKKDCLNTEKGREIMTGKHTKKNYANHPTLSEYKTHWIYNIDIKGAYASCLMNNGLITPKTYDYLLNLKKDERLPAVGMLAKSHIKYFYEGGSCVDVKPFRAETSELFFYLIQEIDVIMREIKWILGDYFIYYWVDGVFFSEFTPQSKIDEVLRYLDSINYRYTFEMVYNFDYKNEDGQCKISLDKEDEHKEWNFRSSCADDDILKKWVYRKSVRERKHDTQDKN